MKAYLDTNVLIRHLTRDQPEASEAATALLAGDHELILTDVVVAECVYVLKSFYRASRADIAEMIRSAIVLESVTVSDSDALFRALQLYERNGLDFAEAYLVATAETSGVMGIASFDKAIDRVPSVTRIY